MTRQFNFYQCRVNDKPASIYLDLGLKAGAPDPKRPQILVVWAYLRYPDPDNALATDAEFEALGEMEDRLAEALSDRHGARYAGRITHEGRREFYFYSASASGMEAAAKEALATFGNYRIDYWSQPDPEWKQYLNVLFPKGASLRWMQDRDGVAALHKRGAAPGVAQALTHASSFSAPGKRLAFAGAVENAGFTVRAMSERPGARFDVRYELAQAPTLETVFATTGLLTQLSEKHGGTYQGWECVAYPARGKAWWKFW